MTLSKLCKHGMKLTLSAVVFAGISFTGVANAQQSAWVKICDDTPLQRVTKDGKTEQITKNICLTHHERLDGNSGRVIVSAALRKVKGEDKHDLMIMVPLGMALRPGMKTAVYTKEQWARAEKKELVKDDELKPLSMEYSFCDVAGCTAEIEAPSGLIDTMINGGGLMVLSLNAAGRPVAFPIPLTGFKQAHTGDPVDNAKYAQARRRLMRAINERMRARIANRATGGLLPEPKKVE